MKKGTKQSHNKLIVILGPTASGKSELAVRLAKEFNGEIISADSRQVYKGLNLASGKITKQEMQNIPHHCLDMRTLRTYVTAAQFQKCANRAIHNIHKKRKTPFLVGGTAFYISAVTENITIPEVPPDWSLRKKLEKQSEDKLFATLKKLDPHRAKTIEKKNKRRLIRAIDIVKKTGKPVPPITRQKNVGQENEKILFIGVRRNKKELETRIQKRLDKRLRSGMVAEIKHLHQKGISWKRLEELGLEPRWIARFLQGKITKEEMKQELLSDILRFTKRQNTWWKHDNRIHWIRSYDEARHRVQTFLLKK